MKETKRRRRGIERETERKSRNQEAVNNDAHASLEGIGIRRDYILSASGRKGRSLASVFASSSF